MYVRQLVWSVAALCNEEQKLVLLVKSSEVLNYFSYHLNVKTNKNLKALV